MKAKIIDTDTPFKQKTRVVTRNAFLFAFIAFAAVITVTVAGVNAAIKTGKILAKNGRPAAWNVTEATAELSTETVAKQIETDEMKFVQYTTSVRNNSGSGHYLTHAAAFVTESANERNGFLPMVGDTVEYTYTPENEYSWVIIAIANPANNQAGSKLSEEVYLAAAGTEHDTAYFRFNVRPGNTLENDIKTQVEFLARNASGATEFTVGATQVAYSPEATIDPSAEVAVVEDPNATEVLGEQEYDVATSVVAALLPVSEEDLVGSTSIWIMIVLGVAAVSLVVYLPARR